MAWVPVEEIIRDRQDAYYRAISSADRTGDARMFIEFMLTALRDALVVVKKSVGKGDKKSGKKSDKKILDYLKGCPSATLDELQELTGLSSGGIRKAIRRLKDAKLLRRVGPDKGGHWEVIGPTR